MDNVQIVLGLLAVVAFLAAIGWRVSLANPIVFALGGLLLALIPGIPRITLSPELVLIVFLPALIFAAAQDTSWAEVRQNARPILFLAVGLVVANMVAVAVAVHWVVSSLPWAAAFTLGAIVAPPDPVAAKAIADALHLPRRLVAVLEGEGLFNDATALVAFQVASGIVVAGTAFHLGPSLLRFGYSVVVAVVIGIVVGWIGRWVLKHVGDPAAENTVTLLLPFVAYLPAEEVHASGVLAVLTLALYLSHSAIGVASSEGRQLGRSLWEMIDFLLTGLSFVLVGLQVHHLVDGLDRLPLGQVLLATFLVCLVVLLIRPLWVFTVAYLSYRARHALLPGDDEPTPSVATLTVISWAGMRGVVSLAIALSLPQNTEAGQPFPGRDLIVCITFVVILVTLIGQGLTLPALVRRLGVTASKTRGREQELSTQLHLLDTAVGRLDELSDELHAPPESIERVRQFYAERRERLERQQVEGEAVKTGDDEAQVIAATNALLHQMLDLEQVEIQRLQQSGESSPHMLRGLQRQLDSLRLRTIRQRPPH